MKKYRCICAIIILLNIIRSDTLVAEVSKKNTVEYEFNHKKYEGREPFIEYNGKRYIEIEELAQLLGFYIQYKDSRLYISDTQKEESNTVYFENVLIKKVDREQQVLTMAIGEQMPKQEQIESVVVGKDVRITCPLVERIFPFDVLQEDMKVSMWCIPQKNTNGGSYKALHIEIVAEEGLLTGIVPIIENAIILEINKNQQYIMVKVEDSLEKEKQIMIYVDDNINIKEEGSKETFNIGYLEVGQHISIITNGIMTRSMPAQTVGLEIIIKSNIDCEN